LITLVAHALNNEKQPCLSNRHTKWNVFRRFVNERLTLNVSTKTEENIEAAVNEPEEEEVIQLLEHPYQLQPSTNSLKRADVQEVIDSLIS
jgi:hypothetical protein